MFIVAHILTDGGSKFQAMIRPNYCNGRQECRPYRIVVVGTPFLASVPQFPPNIDLRMSVRTRLITVAGPDRRVALLGGEPCPILIAGTWDQVNERVVLARTDILTLSGGQMDMPCVVRHHDGRRQGEDERQNADDHQSLNTITDEHFYYSLRLTGGQGVYLPVLQTYDPTAFCVTTPKVW
jgi:hypothetical protein